MKVRERRLLGLVSQPASQPACLSVCLSISVCVVDSMMVSVHQSFNHHHDDVLVDTDSSRCCMHSLLTAFRQHSTFSFHIFFRYLSSIVHIIHIIHHRSTVNCQLSTVNSQLSAPTERRSSQVKARQRLHRHIHMSTPAEPAAVSIWDADASGVDTWIRSISALIPKGE
jgi:hypothetical protein